MPESYQTILQRYINTQIVNPRKSAEFFGGLANQGSVAAAFTAGLLNARADQADAIQNQLAAALQDQKLQMEQQQVKNQTDRVPYQNFSDYQSGMLQGANADYRGVETGLLSRFGAQRTLADIANTNANTYQSYAASNSTLMNADTGRITALSNAGVNQANISSLDLKTALERQYGGKERQAGIDSTYANIGVAQQNANTSAANAQTNQFQAQTQYQYNAGQWWQNQQELGLKRQELGIREKEIANKASGTNNILNELRDQQLKEAQDKAKGQALMANLQTELTVLDRFSTEFAKTGKSSIWTTGAGDYLKQLFTDARSLDKTKPQLTDVELPYINSLLSNPNMTPEQIDEAIKRRKLDINYLLNQQQSIIGE